MSVLRRVCEDTFVDLKALVREGRVWGLVVGAIVLLALAGPFGSYVVLGFPTRLAMWALVVLAAFSCGAIAFFVLRNLMGESGVAASSATTLAVVLTTVPVTLVALLVDQLFIGFPITWERAWIDWLNLSPFVIALVLLIGITQTADGSSEALRENKANHTPFLQRLRREIGTELHYLTSQDHYIAIKTARGSDLVLMRFSDAVTELSHYDGMRIHRSHWVSRAAISGHERIKGRLHLVMLDGTRLPVSRSFVAALRASNYLPQRADFNYEDAAGRGVHAGRNE